VLLEIDIMKAKVSRVTQKGQVVIPMKLRKKLGIREGTPVTFLEEDNRLILQPLTTEYVAKLRGVLKGEPSPLKTLLRERKRERYT
jgi:AbrB family looped-hinge helix DNA binding protein